MRTLAGTSVGWCIMQATPAFCQLHNLSSRTGLDILGGAPLAAGSLPKCTWIDWSFATGCQRGGPPDMSTFYTVHARKGTCICIRSIDRPLSTTLARCDERGIGALASQSTEERARPINSKQHMLKVPLPFVEAHDWRASSLV